MKCSECEGLIYEYLDNELDFNSTEMMNIHFSQCSSCNNKFHDIQQALSVFKTQISAVKVSDDFSQRVISEIETQETSKFLSYTIFGFLVSSTVALAAFTSFLYPVLQFAIEYTIHLIKLWFGVVSILPFNNILLIAFSIVLLFIAIAMRGIINMEEGKA